MFDLEGEGEVKGFNDKETNATYMIPPLKYDVALMSVGFFGRHGRSYDLAWANDRFGFNADVS